MQTDTEVRHSSLKYTEFDMNQAMILISWKLFIPSFTRTHEICVELLWQQEN